MELSVVNTTDSLQTDESSNVDKNTKPEIEGGDSIKVIPKPPTKPQVCSRDIKWCFYALRFKYRLSVF